MSYYLLPDRGVIANAQAMTTRMGPKFRRDGIGMTRAAAELELAGARQTLRLYSGNARIAERTLAKIAELEALLDPEAEITAARREVQAAHPDHGGDAESFQKAKRRLKLAKEKRHE